MAWMWKADPTPEVTTGLQELGFNDAFDSQAEAEAWLTATYEQLLGAGVRSVTLYEEDRLVYGPMSLEAE